MPKIKREVRNHRYYWVARQKGKILTSRKVKDSKINKKQATNLFMRNGSFDKDIIIRREKLSNKTTEITKISKSPNTKPVKSPSRKGRTVVYQVVGLIDGKTEIHASSKTIGNKAAQPRTFNQAKRDGEENFWSRVSQFFGDDYDEDSGRAYTDRVKYRAGWKYYVST